MKIVEWSCDRCGLAIAPTGPGPSRLVAECGPLRRSLTELDLCPGCSDDLLRWIGSAVGREIRPDEGNPARVREGDHSG
jgi:hypothetical protein